MRVTYTEEYHACIWTSLGENESVYASLLTVKVIPLKRYESYERLIDQIKTKR